MKANHELRILLSIHSQSEMGSAENTNVLDVLCAMDGLIDSGFHLCMYVQNRVDAETALKAIREDLEKTLEGWRDRWLDQKTMEEVLR